MGHAYEIVMADVMARYHRLAGRDVLFVTGSDDHGQVWFGGGCEGKGKETNLLTPLKHPPLTLNRKSPELLKRQTQALKSIQTILSAVLKASTIC